MSKVLGKLKEKAKLGLELLLIGAASTGWTTANSKAYQEPPAIIAAQASQEKQAPSASYSQQNVGQTDENDNVGVFIPVYYDHLTTQKLHLMNAKRIYRVKVMEGDTITKYVRVEDWPDFSPLSDSLIGTLYTALNGKNADVNTLILGEYVILEDIDGNKKIFGRPVEEKDKVPVEEVQRIIQKNVYNVNNGGKK